MATDSSGQLHCDNRLKGARVPHFETTPGVVSARLRKEDYEKNFADLHKPLGAHEALVAADRCYFCHDAPCVAACPTEIDIPLFIRQISSGMPAVAARTILDQNILGGMCARACPTETLCEEACVREAAEGQPVEIGLLQRYATDALIDAGVHPYERAPDSGRQVAVVGAGPAGLACAHRLSMRGHRVVIHELRGKPGGLNEFGIAFYKTVDGFAAREVDWLLSIGGIEMRTDQVAGKSADLFGLREAFDAVFLGIGLTGVNALRAEGETLDNVEDAVSFIADLRQAGDLSAIPVGRDIVVIGGGMTAIDAGVQSRLLGAERVTIAYRRGREDMNASRFEQDLALKKGVCILTHVRPVAIRGHGDSGPVREVEFMRTRDGPEGVGLQDEGSAVRIPADQVFLAIGQRLQVLDDALVLENGKIAVDERGRTSLESVWAGGDCVSLGEDLTVTAVAQGRDAAEDIHRALTG